MTTPLDETLLVSHAARAAQEWRAWLLPARAAVLAELGALGEAVTNLPQPVALAASIAAAPPIISGTPAPFDVEVTGDITLYPVAGAIAVSSGGRVAWLRYTGKASSPNRFTGATRLAGDLGAFPIGSAVDVRVLISDKLTRVSIEESEQYGAAGQPWCYDWRATVEGVSYDAARFPADATFLLEARFYAEGDGWSDWLYMARGYASEGYGIEYDPKTGARRWDGTIRSLAAYVERHNLTSRRYGQVSLTPASVSASSSLGNPMSVEPEEFTHHAGNAQPGNVADDNPNSRWISSNAPTRGEGLPTIPPNPGWQEGLVRIQGVGVVPATGAGTLQWIELVAVAWPALTDNYVLTIKHPTDAGQSSTFNPSGSAGWPGDPAGYYIPVPPGVELKPPSENGQPGIILTNDVALYTERYGQPDWPVYGWRQLEVNGAYPGRNVELPDDAAGLMLRYRIEGVGTRGVDFVAYGTAADPADFFITNDWNQGSTPHWGTGVGAIDNGAALGGAGSSIRRVPALTDTNRAADWQIDPRPVPGDPGIVADDAWLMIDVPEFVTETVTPMTATEPGEGDALVVTDATPLDAAGELMIGSERVAYTLSTTAPLTTVTVTERGAGGTTAAIHTAGTRVYQYLPERNEATARESIGRVELARPESPRTAAGLPVRLRIGTLWGGDASATATGAGWEATWYGDAPLLWFAVPDGAGATLARALPGWPSDAAANRRYDKLLLRFEEMTDGGRAKLNEWRLYRSRPNVATGSEPGLGAVARALLEEVLEPEEVEVGSAFALMGGAQDATILSGPLIGALQELCEAALVAFRFTRDGKARFELAPHHPGHLPTPRLTLGGDDMRGQSETRRSRLAGAPVEVIVEDRRTGNVTRARYPQTGGRREAIEVTIRPAAVLAFPAAAIARALYIANQSRAHEMRATSAGLAPLVVAGDWLYADSYGVATVPRRSSWRVASVAHASDGPTELTLVEWRPHE